MVITKKITAKKTVSKRKAVKKTMKGYSIESPEYGKIITEIAQIQNYVNKSGYIAVNWAGMKTIYIKNLPTHLWLFGTPTTAIKDLVHISEDKIVALIESHLWNILKTNEDTYEVKFFKTPAGKGKPFKTIKF